MNYFNACKSDMRKAWGFIRDSISEGKASKTIKSLLVGGIKVFDETIINCK